MRTRLLSALLGLLVALPMAALLRLEEGGGLAAPARGAGSKHAHPPMKRPRTVLSPAQWRIIIRSAAGRGPARRRIGAPLRDAFPIARPLPATALSASRPAASHPQAHLRC